MYKVQMGKKNQKKNSFLKNIVKVGSDCSHEIKRRLVLGRKVMTNLDSIFKNRDITLPTNVSSPGCGFSSGHLWM